MVRVVLVVSTVRAKTILTRPPASLKLNGVGQGRLKFLKFSTTAR